MSKSVVIEYINANDGPFTAPVIADALDYEGTRRAQVRRILAELTRGDNAILRRIGQSSEYEKKETDKPQSGIDSDTILKKIISDFADRGIEVIESECFAKRNISEYNRGKTRKVFDKFQIVFADQNVVAVIKDPFSDVFYDNLKNIYGKGVEKKSKRKGRETTIAIRYGSYDIDGAPQGGRNKDGDWATISSTIDFESAFEQIPSVEQALETKAETTYQYWDAMTITVRVPRVEERAWLETNPAVQNGG